MKKIFCILSLAAVLVAGCGPRSEIEDLKKDIKSLKEADAALWEEMSAAIEALEKELLGRIYDTRDKLDKSIDEAVQDLMALMDAKLRQTQKYLDNELAAKKKIIDGNVEALKDNTDASVTALDMTLETTRDLLHDAIDKNDKEQEALLRELEGKLESMTSMVGDAEKQAQAWQTRLDNIQEEGMYEAIAKLEKDTQTLKNFDIQKAVDDMESRLKLFSKVVLDDLTEEQMKEVKSMLDDIESLYSEVEGFVSDSESMADEMESLLDDWQGQADDFYDAIESYTSDLSDRLDYMADYLETSYDDAQSLEESVNEWLNYLQSLNDDLTDYNQRTEAMADDWDGQHDDIESRADDLASIGDELIEQSNALMYDVDAYMDAHPWMFD